MYKVINQVGNIPTIGYIYCYWVILLYAYISIWVLCYLSIALLHAYSMGVLLSLYLYSIFVPDFDLYFL